MPRIDVTEPLDDDPARERMLAACGGSSSAPSGGTGAGGSAARASVLAASAPAPTSVQRGSTSGSSRRSTNKRSTSGRSAGRVTAAGATKLRKAQSKQLVSAVGTLTACMRAHGVKTSSKVPAPGFGTENTTTKAGSKACGAEVKARYPEVQLPAVEAEAAAEAKSSAAARVDRLPPALTAALEKFAACMREHGIDLPPPVTTGGSLFDMKGVDKSSPQFSAAEAACDSLLQQATKPDIQP